MENVKVDIRKLQLLNDRINQCIDALNQVRLSAHGLSHTTGMNPFTQGLGQGQNLGVGGYQNTPFQGQNLGVGGYQTNPFQGGGFGQPGLGHTGLGQGYQTPFGVPGLGQQPWGQTQGWPQTQLQQGVPFSPGQYGFGGLSHTSDVEIYNRGLSDPYMAARIAQTFPYAYLAFPPVVPLS